MSPEQSTSGWRYRRLGCRWEVNTQTEEQIEQTSQKCEKRKKKVDTHTQLTEKRTQTNKTVAAEGGGRKRVTHTVREREDGINGCCPVLLYFIWLLIIRNQLFFSCQSLGHMRINQKENQSKECALFDRSVVSVSVNSRSDTHTWILTMNHKVKMGWPKNGPTFSQISSFFQTKREREREREREGWIG